MLPPEDRLKIEERDKPRHLLQLNHTLLEERRVKHHIDDYHVLAVLEPMGVLALRRSLLRPHQLRNQEPGPQVPRPRQ